MHTLVVRGPILFCIGWLLVGVLSTRTQGANFEPIELKGVSDWAVHEVTGRVFAALRDELAIVELDPSSGEVRRFELGQSPTELLIKRDFLLVVCPQPATVHVIDLSSNKQAGRVQLNANAPYSLFSSQLDDHLAYCICDTNEPGRSKAVLQIDISEMSIRKQTPIQFWGQSSPMHVAMSRDGNWIVPDGRGRVSPSGADLMKVDPREASFLQIQHLHQSFGPIVAGPWNRYWTLGSALYGLDLVAQDRSFTGSLVAIHPHYDLAVSLAEDKLVFERFGDASRIGTAAIATPPKEISRRGSNKISFDATLQFDLKNHRVFCGTATHANWINLGDFADQLEPKWTIVAPSEVHTLAEQILKVPLRVASVEAGPKTDIAISNGPAGAKIENGELTWTPGLDQAGIHRIELTLSLPLVQQPVDKRIIAVQVELPNLEFAFTTKSMKLSPNGQFAVVWGPDQGQESRHPAHMGPDGVAVVDLESMQILAHKTLPQGVRDAEIDNDFVYIAPASGNLFYRLDRKLSGNDRQFLQATPQQLTKVSEDVLAAVGSSTEFFDVNTMRSAANYASENASSPGAIQVISENLVHVHGRLLNRKTGQLLQITNAPHLPAITTGRPQYIRVEADKLATLWGRRVAGNALLNYRGSRIATFADVQAATISAQYPVAVLLTSANIGRQVTKSLQFADLTDGTIHHSAVIETQQSRQTQPNFYGLLNRMLIDGQRVYILIDNKLYLTRIPDSIIANLSRPAHFSKQQTTELTVGPNSGFALRTSGDSQGVEFTLMLEYPGVRLDRNSGEIQIDSLELWKHLFEPTLPGGALTHPAGRHTPSPFEQQENARHYQQLTGKPLPKDQLALQLPLSILLRDADGQEDEAQFVVLLRGPRAQLEAAVKAAEKKQAEARAEAERRRQQAAVAQQAAMKQPESEEDTILQRLDKLEARMRRIEAALDSVLKALENKK